MARAGLQEVDMARSYRKSGVPVLALACAWAAMLALAPCALAANGDGTVVKGEIGKRLDEVVARAGEGGFWGAVLVARKGEVLLAKGYGAADYKTRRNDTRTLFEIASTSKQFTAAAVLKLEMEGRLSLSDTLQKFWKDAPADKARVTVLHLLTHTSGIDQNLGIPYASPMSREEFAKHILGPPLVSEPGEKFAYSNACYALLAAIVEIASGTSFEKYCHEKLFKPAGLVDTGFVQDGKLDAKRASSRECEWYPGATAVNWCWSWGYRGMGGVVSTVYDMFRWDRALRTEKVLNAKAIEKYYTPLRSGYALGWMVDMTESGSRRVSHAGGVAGFVVNYLRDLDDDIVVVVLSNGKTDVHGISNGLAALLVEKPKFRVFFDLSSADGNGRIMNLGSAASWEARKIKGGVALALGDRRKKAAVALIELPDAAARSIAFRLNALLGPPGKAAEKLEMEGGVYLNPYELDKGRLTLEKPFDILIRLAAPAEGSPAANDGRVELIFQDGEAREWPIMSSMDPGAARKLAEDLAKASGK